MERVATAIVPVVLVECEAGPCTSVVEIWRNVHFYPGFLRETRSLRVTPRNEDTTIGEELVTKIT